MQGSEIVHVELLALASRVLPRVLPRVYLRQGLGNERFEEILLLSETRGPRGDGPESYSSL
jgi:hypothetical protein